MPESTGKRVSFASRAGITLSGQLELPEKGQQPYAYAVFAHCFTCTKNYKAPVFVSRALAEHGIATLRFDFTGLGNSGGDFSRTTLGTNVDDVLRAAIYLEEHYEAPRLLIGHSMGGAAALLAAPHLESVELVTTIAAPSRPGKLGQRLTAARDEAVEKGVGKITINGRDFFLRQEFFDDLKRQDLEKIVANLEKKLLVIHAPDDDVVPFSSAEELMEWARLPKSLVKLEGADHLIGDPAFAEQIANAIAVRLPK